MFLNNFFNVYLFLRERERDLFLRERGRHRIQSKLQGLSCQHRARCRARIHEPWVHDLSWSQTLNQPSHPGAPFRTNTCFIVICKTHLYKTNSLERYSLSLLHALENFIVFYLCLLFRPVQEIIFYSYFLSQGLVVSMKHSKPSLVFFKWSLEMFSGFFRVPQQESYQSIWDTCKSSSPVGIPL